MNYPDPVRVKVGKGYQLIIEYKDGQVREIDMQPYLNKGVFLKLKDMNLFKTARIYFNTIAWDQNIDIDPGFVYHHSKPLGKTEPAT